MNKKQLRKAMSPAGWTMLIYYLLLTGCVTVTMIVELMLGMIFELAQGNLYGIDAVAAAAENSAWGYFVGAGVGLIILFVWKKRKFWRDEIWARGKPMTPGDFFGLLAIFLSAQLVYQVVTIALELILNAWGLTMMEGLETMSAGSDSFSMFLYVGVLAPVTEELLCRGLVQRTLMPFGKRTAIVGSAFLFGMFHGNILQAPYAFLVGLVLGYVAAEYSIGWAMVLHMINNLVLGDMLTRLTEGLGDVAFALILWGILLACAVGAIVTLVRRRHEIRVWRAVNAPVPGVTSCFFTSAGVITFTVVMVLSMIATCFVLITPLS